MGTIYHPPNQSNFFELLNENMNKIDSISNKIYILGGLNINLSLNDSYIFFKTKTKTLNNKITPSEIKSYYEFCTFFWLASINKGSNTDNM